MTPALSMTGGFAQMMVYKLFHKAIVCEEKYDNYKYDNCFHKMFNKEIQLTMTLCYISEQTKFASLIFPDGGESTTTMNIMCLAIIIIVVLIKITKS